MMAGLYRKKQRSSDAEIKSDIKRISKINKIIFEGKRGHKLAEFGQTINENQLIKNLQQSQFSFKIFNRKIKKTGGFIRLYVDLSGSMRNYPDIGSFCYDFFCAFEKKIPMDIIGFSADRENRISVIDHIKNKNECIRIKEDEKDYHDDLGNCLVVCNKHFKPKTAGKILNVVISDGLPEACDDGEDIPREKLVSDIKKAIVKIENSNNSFFAIMLNKYPNRDYLNQVFRGKIYQTKNLSDGVEKIAKKINRFLDEVN